MKRPDIWQYWILVTSCVLASLLGIGIGAYVTKCPEDGGRGGAVAVAAALAALFLSKGYGRKIFEARTTIIPEIIASLQKMGNIEPTAPSSSEDLKAIKDELKSLLDSNAKEQTLQNRFLAGATAFGTIAWGFGDVAVKYILQFRHIPMCK